MNKMKWQDRYNDGAYPNLFGIRYEDTFLFWTELPEQWEGDELDGENIVLLKYIGHDGLSWTPGSWILGMTDRIFRIHTLEEGDRVSVRVPVEEWDRPSPSNEEEHMEYVNAKDRGYYVVYGDKEWFKYKIVKVEDIQ